MELRERVLESIENGQDLKILARRNHWTAEPPFSHVSDLEALRHSTPETARLERDPDIQRLEERLSDIANRKINVSRYSAEHADAPNGDDPLFIIHEQVESVIKPAPFLNAGGRYQALDAKDKIITVQHPLRALHGRLSRSANEIQHARRKMLEASLNEDLSDHFYGIGADTPTERLLQLSKTDYNHGLRAEKDRRFTEELSRIYTEPNMQGLQDESFLIITDRLEDADGKFDIVHPDNADEVDPDAYAAVLVDNLYRAQEGGWHLGAGMEALRALPDDGNTPILYQTAHDRATFTDVEKQRVQDEGGILIGKNVAPKIHDTVRRAQKARSLDTLLRRIPELDRHTVRHVPIGPNGYMFTGTNAVTLSEKAERRELSELEHTLLEEADLDVTEANHRLYVLAQLHANLKPETVPASWESESTDFYEWDTIEAAIDANADISGYALHKVKAAYKDAVEKHDSLEDTVIMHGDTKGDNWFAPGALGDYGSSGAGRPYKDLAKTIALHELPEEEERHGHRRAVSKDSFEEDQLEERIEKYYALRKQVDPQYDEDLETLKRRTFERVVTESMRTVMYKADELPEEKIRQYVDLAFRYGSKQKADAKERLCSKTAKK